MRKKTRIFTLIICMIFSAVPVFGVVSAAKQEDTEGYEDASIYEISSIEDFREFASACQDASWSVGREVHLMADISFSGESFESIPYFAGRFDGEGHTISGIGITDNLSRGGLFSETAGSAYIFDLSVQGTIMPGGSQEKVGGIVGDNAGKIVNCAFGGNIGADNETGGIAGHNQASGRIRGCRATGAIEGISDIGGIVGINEGVIRDCDNNARVNESQHEESVSEDQLTAIFEHITTTGEINSLRNTANITDIGGITGLNKGTVERCENRGTVGYQYVGYNVGGIAGRSSGFISDSQNSGSIYGRKDVGGITGQLQPYLEIEFAQDDLENLKSELDKLDTMVNAAGEDARSYSARTTEQLNQLSAVLTQAKTSANDIINGSLSYADALTEQTNLNTGTIKESAASLSSIMQELQKGMNQLESSADVLVKETETFIDQAKMSQEDKAEADNALNTLQGAMNEIAADGEQLTSAVQKLSADLNTLQKDMDNSGFTSEKTITYTRMILEDVKNINKYTSAISKSLNQDLIPSLNGISALVTKYAQAASTEAKALRKTLDTFFAAEAAVSENISKLTGNINRILEMVNEGKSYSEILSELSGEDISNDMRNLQKSLSDLSKATDELGTAVQKFLDSTTMSDADKTSLRQYNDTIRKAADEIAKNGNKLQSAVDKLVADLDTIQTDIEKNQGSLTVIKNDIITLKNDCDALTDEAAAITSVLNTQVIPALNSMSDLLEKYGDGPDEAALRAAVNGMMNSITGMPDTLTELSALLDTLNEKTDTVIPKLDDSTRNSGEKLYQSMLEAGSQMNAITRELGDGTDRLTTDLQEISGEFHDCMNLLINSIQSTSDTSTDPLEHIEDLSQEELSEEEITSLTKGRLTSSTNGGTVTGSLNLGGIVGTVGVESDLDPETDIISSGNSSLNYTFQSKCIIDKCKNYGDISGRKNNLGGIAGLMNIGLVTDCGSYGDVSSESGSYIGGLAGFSQAAIRSSFARGALSGMRYIGGAAGYGYIISNDVTMVRITGAEQEYGAIAGAVSERDEKYLYGNLFVAEQKPAATKYRPDEISGARAGIGGVSFPGIAEEISYEDLLKKEEVPEEFRTMTLTFLADEKVVKVVSCSYGDAIESEELPEVPEKEGYSGEWDREDFSYITGDDTIQAVYPVEITTLASSEKRGGKQSILLVDGNFGNDTVLGLTPEAAKEGESERWHVTLSDTGIHEYRFLPEDENAVLYLEKDGEKSALDTDSYGKYRTFSTDESDFVLILAQPGKSRFPVWLLLPLLAAAAAFFGWRYWKRHLSGKGKKKK